MTQPASIPPLSELEEQITCCHHWVIQPATGPVSQGMCLTCGEEREFKNYVEAATWGDPRLSNRSGSKRPVAAAEDEVDEE